MPRQKNTRPTLIYWLVDMCPETIAAGWPQGKPFYCGKTVETPDRRLRAHLQTTKTEPTRPVCKYLLECGDHIRIRIMETVPPESDWCERERWWIYTLRTLYPGATNSADGGSGAPGWVPDDGWRSKKSAERKANWELPEYRERMLAANQGAKRTDETRANMAAKARGRKHTPESRAKIGAALKGVAKSPECIKKRVAAVAGKKRAPGIGFKGWATRRANAERSENV